MAERDGEGIAGIPAAVAEIDPENTPGHGRELILRRVPMSAYGKLYRSGRVLRKRKLPLGQRQADNAPRLAQGQGTPYIARAETTLERGVLGDIPVENPDEFGVEVAKPLLESIPAWRPDRSVADMDRLAALQLDDAIAQIHAPGIDTQDPGHS